MTEFYQIGTAKVQNGEVTVSSVGLAAWTTADVISGNVYSDTAGNLYIIATDPVFDATLNGGDGGYKFDLTVPYQGADNASITYVIAKTSEAWGTNRQLALEMAEVIRVRNATQLTEAQLNDAITEVQSARDDTVAAKASFFLTFLGAFDTLPTVDNEGNPLTDYGQVYQDEGSGHLFIREAGEWVEMLAGQKGDQGVGAGIQWTFLAATTDADPGAGSFFLNASNHTLADKAWVDNLSAAGADVGAAVMAWGDGSSATKGLLYITDAANRSVFRLYKVTVAPIDKTGYRELALDYVASAGVLTASTVCEFSFAPLGDQGDAGADGVTSGVGLVFSTTTTDADPGAGHVRFNDPTFGSITEAFVDNSDSGGNATLDWLDGMDDVANAGARGTLRFQVGNDPTSFAEFAVVGPVVDGGGYRKVPVAPIAGDVFVDAAAVIANFVPAGADGENGIDGASPGVTMRYETSTTDALPSNGGIRFNDPSISTATAAYVAKTDLNGDDLSDYLATLGSSSNTSGKGDLVVKRLSDGKQTAFVVTGLTDASGYVKLALATGAGNASLSAADQVGFVFTRAGDQGGSGAGSGDVLKPTSSVAVDELLSAGNTDGSLLKGTGKSIADLLLAGDNLSDIGNPVTALDNLSVAGSNIASASTVDLESANGNELHVTGTTATTAVTLGNGHYRHVIADAAWPLTNGSSLILNNGGSSFTCSAGDHIDFWGGAAGAVYAIISPKSGSLGGAGIPIGYLDTDTALTANSDTKVPSQKAIKAYIAANTYMPGGTDVAVADGGTGASTAGGARTNLGLGTIATQDASAVALAGGTVLDITQLRLLSTDAGATLNPFFDLDRNSATPAANDIGGGIQWNFRNASAAKTLLGQMHAVMTVTTAGAETGFLHLLAKAAGTLVDAVLIGGALLGPVADNTIALGAPATAYSAGYWSSGAILGFANGDYTLTHSTGVLTANKDLRVTTAGTNTASVVTVGGTQTLTGKSLSLGQVTGLAANMATWLAGGTSAQLAAAMTDEVGTGALYFVGGALGTPASVTLTNGTGLPIAGITGLGSGVATWLGTPTAANLLAATTAHTGSGNLVFATSPALTTPDIGNATGSFLTLTNVADGDFLTLTSTDAGALSGASIQLYRNSASPAANDVLSGITWWGKTSTAVKVQYAGITATIISPTNGSQTSRLNFQIGSNDVFHIDGSGVATFRPHFDNSSNLGDTTHGFGSVFMADSGTIWWGGGNGYLTAGGTAFSFNAFTSYAFDNLVTITRAGINLILNQTVDAASIQVMQLVSSRATPTAADNIYESSYLNSSTGVKREAVRRYSRLTTVTNAAEQGDYLLYLIKAGAVTGAYQFSNTSFNPLVTNTIALGTTALEWADLHLGSGSTINWFNGDLVLTHSSGLLRISGGNLQNGTLSTTGLSTGIQIANATTGLLSISTTLATTAQIVKFYNTNGLVGGITLNASAAAFNTTSNKLRKRDWRDFDSGTIVDALEWWEYEAIATGETLHGVLAQDAQLVFPEAITHIAANDDWFADYSKFVPILGSETKKLRARVAALEAEVDLLKAA